MSIGSLLQEVVNDHGKTRKSSDEDVNIIEFIEESWGLGGRLFPVQRVILKAHYGLALDTNPHGFDLSKPIPRDHPNFSSSLVDAEGYYKHRVPISDFRREKWSYYSEAEYLAYLYSLGRCNIKEVIPGQQRREMILAIGRRSGKSYISACIAAYETYRLLRKQNPQKYFGISESNTIQIIAVATDKDQAGLLYNDVSSHFKKCTYFAPFMANNTQSYARFQTPDDIKVSCRYADDPRAAKVSLKVTFRSCIAKGLRGAGNFVIILDELAFFTDNKSQSSGEAVYKAVSPSKSAFSPKGPTGMPLPGAEVESRMVLISSPNGRDGFFFEHYMSAMKNPGSTLLAIQAPTWEVNPTVPASEFLVKYGLNKRDFWQEFGAEFSDRTRGWLEGREDFWPCVDPKRRPILAAPAKRPHFVGLDFGLRKDATAVAIGHLESIGGQPKVILDLIEEKRVGAGIYADSVSLDYEDVVEWIYQLSRRYLIHEGIFDQWAGIIFEQALHKKGLTQFKSAKITRPQASQYYRNLRDLFDEQRIVLYNYPISNDDELCPYLLELLSLQEEQVSRGVTIVSAPKLEGNHDDMSDALVRMAWLATESMGKGSLTVTSSRAGDRSSGRIHTAEERVRTLLKRRGGGSSLERSRKPLSPKIWWK